VGAIWKFYGTRKDGSRLYKNLETGVIAEERDRSRQATSGPVLISRLKKVNSGNEENSEIGENHN
jgi:hypothetical protein